LENVSSEGDKEEGRRIELIWIIGEGNREDWGQKERAQACV
jgi:hypothetical protein